MVRSFFSGFVKIHILYHAAEEPVYGLALITELGRHGYALSPGTLYPVLHGLEQDGYLACRPFVVDGKIRKYYTITREGRRALVTARQHIAELVQEVLAGRRPQRGPKTRRR